MKGVLGFPQTPDHDVVANGCIAQLDVEHTQFMPYFDAQESHMHCTKPWQSRTPPSQCIPDPQMLNHPSSWTHRQYDRDDQ